MSQRPPTEWSTLPVELHRRIVEAAAPPWASSGHPGQDLLSLRLVNRELTVIASEFVFETVELVQPKLSTLLGLVEHILPKYGHLVKRLDFTGDSAVRREVAETVALFGGFPRSVVGDFQFREIPTDPVDAIGQARHAIEWSMFNPTYLYRSVLIAAGLRSIAISQCSSAVAIRVHNADEFFGIPLLPVHFMSIYRFDYSPGVVNLQYPPFQAILKLGYSMRHVEVVAADAPQHLGYLIAMRSAYPRLELLSIGGSFLSGPGDDREVLVDTPILCLTGLEPTDPSVFDLFDRISDRPFRRLEILAPFVPFAELHAFFSLQADNITDLRLLNVPDANARSTANELSLPNLRSLSLVVRKGGRLDLNWICAFGSSPVGQLSLDCRWSDPLGLADIVVEAASPFRTTLQSLSLYVHKLGTEEAVKVGAWTNKMNKRNGSGWHTLPVEFHRRIVSHGALPWNEDGDPGHDLLSLRLVNRELAEIAPEWIYETVELARPFLDTLLGLVETILPKYGRYVKRLESTHSSGLRQEIERRAYRKDFPEDACADFASQPVPTECQVAIASTRAALEKLDSDPTYLFSGLLSGYGLVAAATRLCSKTAAIRIIDSDEPSGIRMVSVGPDVVTQHDEFGLEETYTTSFPPLRALLDQGRS